MPEEVIELRGHLIDSLVLPKVLDLILRYRARYEIQRFTIGVRPQDPSFARIQIAHRDARTLETVLQAAARYGAKPIVRTVKELIPDSVIQSREDLRRGRDMQKDVPVVSKDDFREADAVIFGTPTRFGNVSAQLKNQIDQLADLWFKGELEGKSASVFVPTASLHGGQETTILTMLATLLHLGFIVVGVPYSVKELFTTKGGGSPYGPGHIAGQDRQRELDEEEKAICRALGRRVAEVAMKLRR